MDSICTLKTFKLIPTITFLVDVETFGCEMDQLFGASQPATITEQTSSQSQYLLKSTLQ